MNDTPPPGWYPDNVGDGQRYWDGQRWTEDTAAAGTTPNGTPNRAEASWFRRHKVLSGGLAFVVFIMIVGAAGGEDEDPTPVAADTSTEVTEESGVAAVSEPETESEPLDTDADGVIDEDDLRPQDSEIQSREDLDTDEDGVSDGDDFRPEDPKVQTRDDVDTDRDGVADYQDAFPKDAQYSKDSDGDAVADQLDDFPKDERYSNDSDGDKVADSEDVFPADPSRSKITAGMVNAIGAAESYLGYTAFSRSGLIEQLEYEGYSVQDATFAVDFVKVDWNQQAFKSAKSYLGYTNFSLQGLIEQLQYEGFTYEQAAYGANKAY